MIATDKSIETANALIAKELENSHMSMGRDFYTAPAFHDLDMEAVFKNEWILVDHASRIPDRGQYFLFEIGNESIIIVRESDDRINAFYNVCRHRGSRVCLEKSGKRNLLTCPYHAWSYGLDGSLKAALTMPEGFDKSRYGLHSCHVEVVEGLIFINLSEDMPQDFDELYDKVIPYLQFQGIGEAKIAVKRNYPNQANWKLVVENFIECYHCKPAHPEYCSVHLWDKLLAVGAGPGSSSQELESTYLPIQQAWEASTSALGNMVGVYESDSGMVMGVRVPINPETNVISETIDGSAACAKLLGDLKERDGGQTIVFFNPFSIIAACNDFAVMFRWSPRDADNTDVELTWLVHKDAEEGVDYSEDVLAKVWDITICQDKQITEDNQAGIRSDKYQPGPYSFHEAKIVQFKAWYLDKLKACL